MEKKEQPPVRLGEYGPVKVMRGEHAGKVGYYDDDDDRKAIVYFGEVLEAEYYLIPVRWLRHTDVIPANLERFVREQPDVARQIGVRSAVRRPKKK